MTIHVRARSFHAIIGENGAGKSTVLNILYGVYRQDQGKVYLHGKDVTSQIRSPADAIKLGIGLVSQHYALIPALTVLENIMLGTEPVLRLGILQVAKAMSRVQDVAQDLGLDRIDLSSRTDRLSVAAQQKVEIAKALFRGARILLLDEPTATLTPQEAEALFAVLHSLVERGATVVFVTHKLREVMAHADYVTVLRRSRNAGDFAVHDTAEVDLLQRMIGPDTSESAFSDAREPLKSDVEPLHGQPASADQRGRPLLNLDDVSIRNARGVFAVRNATLTVSTGEIIGIAGVDGSGQRELSQAIVGLLPIESGSARLVSNGEDGRNLAGLNVHDRLRAGISYIPEDRHRAGLILDFSIGENVLLGHEDDSKWGGGPILNRAQVASHSDELIARYDVRIGSRDSRAPSRTLSGGNQQKLVVARAMESSPKLLVACQPTRGLDKGAADFVYKTLRDARDRGLGVILFSLDLDEIMELSDRIAVMYDGEIVQVVNRAEATAESIGALMTGSGQTGSSQTDSCPADSCK